MSDFLTLEGVREAAEYIYSSGSAWRTPLLADCQTIFPAAAVAVGEKGRLFLKMESTQKGGCHKSRGVANQFRHRFGKKTEDGKHVVEEPQTTLVTFSTGNYARAFSTLCRDAGWRDGRAVVVMPDAAPQVRVDAVKANGARVVPTPPDRLQATIDDIVREQQAQFFSPIDDLSLVQAYGSVGLEILDQCPEVDVILVPCGGAGLLTGIATAVKLAGSQAKVIGVDPETSGTVLASFRAGERVQLPKTYCSVEALKPFIYRLVPPGASTMAPLVKNVDDVVVVTDQDILKTVQTMFRTGFVAEPLGCVALAAVFGNRLDLKNKTVVVVISGRNIEMQEMQKVLAETPVIT